jgi:hypothetical protein
MSSDSYRLVEDYSVRSYPCGLTAGTSLRIKREIRVTDHKDKETGKVYSVGEVWAVLPGVEAEPDIIWLRQADGERHTWDAHDILDTFEVVSK